MTNKIKGWQAGLLAAGVGLAASYAYVRGKTRQVENAHPPRGRFVTVDGVRLHYLERGAGPALVLLHGVGVLAEDFAASGLLDKAAGHYRVIAFDRPGYGYSERPRSRLWTPQAQARLIHHALQALGVEQAIVVGHSWAALVAASMALEVPDFVRGLVLLSGYYYPSVRADVPLMAPPAVPVAGDLLRTTVLPPAMRMLWRPMMKLAFSPMPIPAAFDAIPPWLFVRPGQLRADGADYALMIPAAATLCKRYGEIAVPVVIVSGTQDKLVDPGAHSERLHRQIAGSELQLQPGVGHMTQHAHPDRVMAAIASVAGRAGAPVQWRNPKAETLARASESGV